MPTTTWEARSAYIRAAKQVSRASYDHEKRQQNAAKAAKIGNPFAVASFDERSEYIRKATENLAAQDS